MIATLIVILALVLILFPMDPPSPGGPFEPPLGYQ